MDLGLEDKVAIVTGGSEGIGKYTAMALAAEGANVVICARRPDVLEEARAEIKLKTGRWVTSVSADVREPDQVERVFDETAAAFGGPDILVNNAGTASTGAFVDVTDDDWKSDLDLKLFAAIRCSRLAVPYMRKQGGGRIVNVTNLGGKAPGPSSVPTSVSRAAGIALTKAMSKDLAKDNILVNTVCIGLIKSGQHDHRWEAANEKDPAFTRDDYYAGMAGGVPLGRIGETREAADVITFLVSERASYVTGTSINIDGGSSSVV